MGKARLELLAPIYDRLLAPLERRGFRRWREALWRAAPQAGLGLEIGAGTGANFSYYPEGARVVAADLSLRMLAAARTKQDRGRTGMASADVQALPFGDQAFDWAVATLVFCEVPNPAAGLAEVRRVLRPGGRLLLLEHVRPSGWLGIAADVATALSAPLVGEHFNRDTERTVRQAGFTIEHRASFWRDGVILLVSHSPDQDAGTHA
ncbi:class I SAM-dependent methyltransferase [soil metagenome]